jgi:hypothetical protein
MDSTIFHADMQNLLSGRKYDKKKILAAEKAAFLTMAHFIDLPQAESFGEFTVASGTANYTGAIDEPIGAEIDRITSAVFVGSSVYQVLDDWNIRQYQHAYRGQSSTARAGTPSAFCFYNEQFWLYKVPDLSGTVYFTCQRVLTDITDFPDSCFPLMANLTKLYLADPDDSAGAQAIVFAWQQSKQLIKSFKGKMHPKKAVMEKTSHRTQRVRNLNALI